MTSRLRRIGTEKAGEASPLRGGISHLPDADDGVGDQDEQDHKRLHEGRDRVVVVLEEGQNLKMKTSPNALIRLAARISYFSPLLLNTEKREN